MAEDTEVKTAPEVEQAAAEAPKAAKRGKKGKRIGRFKRRQWWFV